MIPTDQALVRIYGNGGTGGGVKFWISARLARALGLERGQLFDIKRVDRGGILELVPATVNVAVQRGLVPNLDGLDDRTPVYYGKAGRAAQGRFHRTDTCAELKGARVRTGRLLPAKLAGRQACTCWLDIAPPADAVPGVA